jgi:hypothetical protein
MNCRHGIVAVECKQEPCKSREAWEWAFLAIHNEPEHESGATCWCEPVSSSTDGKYHINHREQREYLVKFIKDLFEKRAENLESLIGKMGDKFDGLQINHGEFLDRRWQAYGIRGVNAYGETPKIALTNLNKLLFPSSREE